MYDEKIQCRVEIQFSDTYYGTGDHEDPPEVANDHKGNWFVVSYASPTDPRICPPAWKYQSGCPTLDEEISESEKMLDDKQLQWDK